MAREKLSRYPDVEVKLTAERLQDHVPESPYDCAVASFFFHHFSDAEILRLIRHLRGYVRHSLLINDLCRTSVAFCTFLFLSPALPGDVCSDGLLSIRRGFRPRRLRLLLQEVPDADAEVRCALFSRITAEVRFHR